MAKNAQFLDALKRTTFERLDVKQAKALQDLMMADLSDGENFRTKVVAHYKVFGLKDDFIQDHTNGDDFLHFAGTGETHEENNFRALQRLVAEKYVRSNLPLLSIKALASLEESTELLTSLVQCIPELSMVYHFHGEENDPPILTTDALDRIRKQSAVLKSLKFEELLGQLNLIKDIQNSDVQGSLQVLIEEINSLRDSKSSQIPELCNVLEATINLFNENDKALEEKVDEYKLLAQTMRENPAWPLQKLGDLMLALGITILIAGIVLIPFAPLAAAAATTGVGAALMLFGTFYHPKQTGLAGAMNKVVDQISDPVQEPTLGDYLVPGCP